MAMVHTDVSGDAHNAGGVVNCTALDGVHLDLDVYIASGAHRIR